MNEAGDVFVLFNDSGDEKTAILHPTIYGPFVDEEAAQQFIERNPRWDPTWGVLQPIDGGYAGAHIISSDTAEDPEVALSMWEEWSEEFREPSPKKELIFEEYVEYKTPRGALTDELDRISDGIERLRSTLGANLFDRWSMVLADWTPYFALRDSIRGRWVATQPMKQAKDVLSEVNRDLFEREDVVSLLREIDVAIDTERTAFCEELASWLEERAKRIGGTVTPLLSRLVDKIDEMPETELVATSGVRGWWAPRRET